MSDKPKLGEILVQAGVIDAMQLSSALGEQSRWGRRLGVTLIKMGMVEEGHLVRALAKQLGLPVASLSGKRISDDVIALVPGRVASEHGVIPLFVKDDGPRPQLFLGMEDPSNLAVLDDLGFRTGMEIRPVMVGPSELGEAMDRYYLGQSGPTPIELPPTAERPPVEGHGEPMGERNLRVIAKDDAPSPVTSVEAETTTPPPHAGLQPASRDSQIELSEAPQRQSEPARQVPTPPQQVQPVQQTPPPALPEGVLDDIARAIDETERTRVVARAIAQLLIEKGVLTLEEVQTRIAQQKEGPTS
jgi:hypothetical protein